MNLFTKSNLLFTFLGLFSSLNEAADTEKTVLQKLKDQMPLYTEIYDLNGVWNEKLKSKLNDIFTDNPNAINEFPYFRSPLHRAIEQMNVGAVEWLLDKGASIEYGLDKKENILHPKDRADKPGHLLGHLEEYYNDEDKAIKIMELLHKTKLNIAAWPVKESAFEEARRKFAVNVNIIDKLQSDISDDPSSMSADGDSDQGSDNIDNPENPTDD